MYNQMRRIQKLIDAQECAVKKVLSFSLILIASLVLILGVRFWMAAIQAYKADLFLEHWSEQGTPPGPQAWQAARQAAESAISWYPVVNGVHQARLARVHEWRYFDRPFNDPDAQQSRRHALKYYRLATESRPLWPYYWGQLALMKLHLLEADDEFETAYQQAYDSAPWQALHLFELSQMGWEFWDLFSGTQKTRVLQVTKQALEADPRNQRRIRKLLEDTERLSLFCLYYTTQVADADRLCS